MNSRIYPGFPYSVARKDLPAFPPCWIWGQLPNLLNVIESKCDRVSPINQWSQGTGTPLPITSKCRETNGRAARHWQNVIVLAGVSALTVVTGLATSWGIANHPPLEILRAEG